MRKLIIIAASLLTMLATSIVNGQQQKTPAKKQSAPVVARQRSPRKIPQGWFSGGAAEKARTASKVQQAIARAADSEHAELASHFDTSGSFSRYSSRRSGAADRLKAVRNAKVFPNLPTAKPQSVTTVEAQGVETTFNNAATKSVEDVKGSAAESLEKAEGTPTEAVEEALVDLDALPSVMRSADRAVEEIASKPKSVIRSTSNKTQAPSSNDLSGNDLSGFAEPPAEPITLDTPIDLTTPIVDNEITPSKIPEKSWESVARKPDTTWQGVSKKPQQTSEETANEPAESQDGISEPLTVEVEEATAAEPAAESNATTSSAAPAVMEQKESQERKQQSPVLFAEAMGPQTITVGRAATYVIHLESQNEHSAKDVSVLVNIPSWVEVDDNHGSIGTSRLIPDENGHSLIQWKIDHLPGSAKEKLTLKLIPRASRTIDLAVNWMFKPSTSIKQIQVQEPKLEMSVTGPYEVTFGDTQLYTISVSNPGTGDAENVVLHLLPIVPAESTAGTKRIGVLKAGKRRTIKVELTARQAGELQVRARATADGGLQASDAQDVVVRRANLVVEVDGPAQKYAGTAADYTIRISNNGDATARDVTAMSNLPGGAAYISSSDGGTFDGSQKQVAWQIGALRPGDTRVFQFKCQLDTPGTNRVDVRSLAAGDLSAMQSVSTEVESLADLKLTVNDPAGAIPVGMSTNYELLIVNRGTKAAKNIQVVGYFSEGIEPISIGNWRGEVDEGQVVLERIPRIGPGQEMTIRVVAKAQRPGDHVFRAELECRDPHTRLAHEEWTSFYGDPLPVRQAALEPTYGPEASAPQRLDIRR